MNLTQLQTLSVLQRSSSLEQAAHKLHKTQPALSMALKKLEQDCGFAILDRSAYRLKLTAAGQRFAQQAEQLLAQYRELSALSDHLQAGAEASFKIACDEVVELSDLFHVMQHAQQRFRHTDFALSYDYRLLALEKLRQGDVQLAISPWYPVFISQGDFTTRLVGHFELVAVAHRDLIARLSAPLQSLAQLQALPQLIGDSAALDYASGAFAPLQCPQRVKINNSQMMYLALCHGLGWGLISQPLVAKELANGTLLQLTTEEFSGRVHGEVHLVKRRHDVLGPVGEFIWQHAAWRRPGHPSEPAAAI
jgi:DNA-binding transcriptional LysR family regulator